MIFSRGLTGSRAWDKSHKAYLVNILFMSACHLALRLSLYVPSRLRHRKIFPITPSFHGYSFRNAKPAHDQHTVRKPAIYVPTTCSGRGYQAVLSIYRSDHMPDVSQTFPSDFFVLNFSLPRISVTSVRTKSSCPCGSENCFVPHHQEIISATRAENIIPSAGIQCKPSSLPSSSKHLLATSS